MGAVLLSASQRPLTSNVLPSRIRKPPVPKQKDKVVTTNGGTAKQQQQGKSSVS